MPIPPLELEDDQTARLVLRGALDFAILTTDLDGRITSWNPGAQKLLGWSAEEMRGQRLHELVPPEDQGTASPLERMREARTQGRSEHECWQLRKDGSRVWVSGVMTRLEDESSGVQLGYVEILQDRTRYQQAAAEREHEARLRALVEVTPQVVWFADAHASVTYCNPYWVQYTGIALEQTVGDGWASAVHPDHRQRALTTWKQSVANGVAYELELPFRRVSDGAYRWFLARCLPIRDERGQIERWVGIALDIHDRKRAEEALHASGERLRGVADATPGFLWTAGPDGMLDYTSSRWHEYSGTVAGDPAGPGWTAFVHPEDQERVLGAWGAALASGSLYESELRLRSREGTYRWWLARALPLRDAGAAISRWTGVCTDIHELVTARETLSRSREQLEAQVAERTADRDRLWRLSTDVLLVADFQSRLVAVNPAWTRLLDWSEEALVGRSFMDLVHPEDRERTLAEVVRLPRGTTTLRFDNRYQHRDGTYRSLSWTAVADERFIHAVGRDMTAEKLAAAELEQAQEALRQAQKMEAVGQLTGGIAHDFNNLLTGIIGALDMMQRRAQLGQKVDIPRYTTAAMNSAQRAAALAHRLLAFSRRQPLDPKPVSIPRLVSGMEELLRRTLGETIRLEILTVSEPWQTRCDPHQLENALLNLAINARDAMPRGGQLTIETSNVLPDSAEAAHIPELRPGPYVCIRVTDTGTGMPPEVMSRAFEPFFTTKPLGQGTGLGLSMIYGFIRQSAGHARISSEPGRGTTVTLYLPRLQGDASEAEGGEDARRAQAHPEGRGEVVLVVEDEPAVRAIVVDVLEDLGYRAVEAVDGPSGLKLLQGGMRLDLLVTDVGLPGGLNGRQLADAARQSRPGLKVLFMTGYAGNITLTESTLEPGMQLITKPFSIDVLAARIRDMLEPR